MKHTLDSLAEIVMDLNDLASQTMGMSPFTLKVGEAGVGVWFLNAFLLLDDDDINDGNDPDPEEWKSQIIRITIANLEELELFHKALKP